eukprot:CAMPEP_0172608416 /NCGR_PEP_ID=MMETSP1068-20121228/28497_1 /TAXON_ID=35684 /ORGANISM="Pseudopedinella elastica, Strain CCMP716" /LENGTH=257 /DNA_ID=CAMNT_0013411681 /DNA_START=30 /DNA_END=804 /DNA_ORIENTATION=-
MAETAEVTEAKRKKPSSKAKPSAAEPAVAGVPSATKRGEAERYASMVSMVKQDLLGHFRPEFLNRLDEIVVFRALAPSELRDVAALMVADVTRRTHEAQGVALTVGPALLERIISEGSSQRFGARPLRRTVQRLVEDAVAQAVLEGFLKLGHDATLDCEPAGAGGSPGSAAVAKVCVTRTAGPAGGAETCWVEVAASAGIEEGPPQAAAAAGSDAPEALQPGGELTPSRALALRLGKRPQIPAKQGKRDETRTSGAR